MILAKGKTTKDGHPTRKNYKQNNSIQQRKSNKQRKASVASAKSMNKYQQSKIRSKSPQIESKKTKTISSEKEERFKQLKNLHHFGSEMVNYRYFTESIPTKSTVIKKPILAVGKDHFKFNPINKKSEADNKQRLYNKASSKSPNKAVQLAKTMKFGDYCMTQIKQSHKIVAHEIKRNGFKKIKQLKNKANLEGHQPYQTENSYENKHQQEGHPNKHKFYTESTTVSNYHSLLHTPVINQISRKQKHIICSDKKIQPKFNLQLTKIPKKQILDYNDEFMSHYNEMSQSWKRQMAAQKRF